MENWSHSDNDDVQAQIAAFEITVKQIAPSVEYKLEVVQNKNKELLLHAQVLEQKVQFYREKQALHRVMMNDLENMNKKAEMSKELATHYSPF